MSALKEKYAGECVPALKEEFGYKNVPIALEVKES